MGFDLKGYEKDNNMSMTSFALYTFAGAMTLIIVIAALSFYFFIEREGMYDEIVLLSGPV